MQSVSTSCSQPFPGHPDRRVSSERRSARGAFRLSISARALRRRQGRRSEDLAQGFYTDHHDGTLLLMAIGILLLSVADAVFSLQLIERGAQELNPLLDFLIKYDVQIFAWAKIAVTCSVLILLVTHAHYRVFGVMRVRTVLALGLGLYLCLVTYEIALMVLYPPLPQVFLNG